MLLGCRKNEDDVCRRLFQGLEKSIEGSRREHVYLIDDEDLVASYLWRNSRLFHQRLDVLDRVVAGSVQFEDVVTASFGERLAAFAFITGLTVGRRVFAVDGFCKDAGAGGLSHPPWPAEKISMGQLSAFHGILQRGGQRLLSHDRIEGHRAVLARRDNIFIHRLKI